MILSAITTLYNCEKYLLQSLQSIKNQSFKDFEWIIVNDGSTDNSWKIVEDFTKSFPGQIKLVNNTDNKKIPTRRNEAIKITKGKYIAICDGDDISYPGRFLKQVNFLEANEEISVVGGHAIRINGEDQNTGDMVYPPEKHDKILNSILLVSHMNPMIDPTTMFKRSMFDTLGGYTLREDIFTTPDFDLWCRALLRGYKFHNLQQVLIKYRDNPNGVTNSKKVQMIKSHVIVRKEFLMNYNVQRTENFLRGKQNVNK